eukprot:SAG31_NODE_26752_length_437_cov_0.763314_1_plen_35_part_10
MEEEAKAVHEAEIKRRERLEEEMRRLEELSALQAQ